MKTIEDYLLFDFYGNLLTDRMRSIMDLHLNEDLSLGEIADSENISRQGVHDTIKRATKQLRDYEDKLKLAERFTSQNSAVDEAINALDNNNYELAKSILAKLREDMAT